jgi:hypothetical protein
MRTGRAVSVRAGFGRARAGGGVVSVRRCGAEREALEVPVALVDGISQVPKPAMRRDTHAGARDWLHEVAEARRLASLRGGSPPGHRASGPRASPPGRAKRWRLGGGDSPASGVCGVHSTLHFFVRYVLLARREMPLVTERVRNKRDAVTEEFVRERPQQGGSRDDGPLD